MTREEFDALDKLPRQERIMALWAAMAPASRERVWADLDEQGRVKMMALAFDATVETVVDP